MITVERNGRKLDRPSCNGVPLVSAYFAHAEPTGGQPLPSFAMNDAGAIVMRRDGQRMSPALEGAERVDDGYVTEWR